MGIVKEDRSVARMCKEFRLLEKALTHSRFYPAAH